MNPLPLTSLTVFTLDFAAMGCLCFAMERHARQLNSGFRLALWRRPFRWAGWLLLALAALVSVYADGFGIGLVSLLGVLSAATLMVVGLMTYRPQWVIYAAAFCGITGVLILGPMIFARM